MTETAQKTVSAEVPDDDTLAIRELMAAVEGDVDHPETIGLELAEQMQQKCKRVPRPMTGHVELSLAEGSFFRRATSYSEKGFSESLRGLWVKLKVYRPERRKIVLTSFLLLLFLKPGTVIGGVLILLTIIAVYYYIVGSDRFWRRLIDCFLAWERRWPVSAGQLEMRVVAMARRWHWFVGKLPDGLSDALRLPDLRQLFQADAEHDACMSDRLDRLAKIAAS